MVKTEGTESRKRKKMVGKTVDAIVLYAQQNVRVTRSKAANNQEQHERCLTAIPRRQTPTTALKSEPVFVANAADDDITKGTKGVGSNTRKVNAAKRCIQRKDASSPNRDTPKLTATKRCIQRKDASSPNRDKQPKHERVDENINTGDQGLCPSSESSRNSKPSKQKKDFEEFERRLLILCEEDGVGLQPRSLTLPSSTTQHVENVLPSTVVKTAFLKAHSFNLTAMMEGHGSANDDDQAESSIDPALTNVKGYHVKTEVAPTLERILEKYHDIARGCIIKNPKVVVPMLEMLCLFCQKFDNTGLKDISESEIEYLTAFVENFQQMGFEVKWLIERLKDVSEMKRIMTVYPTLRDEKLKRQMKEEEVDKLKQNLSVAEAELGMMKAAEDGKKHRTFHQQIDAFKAKGLALWGTSVFYGLF